MKNIYRLKSVIFIRMVNIKIFRFVSISIVVFGIIIDVVFYIRVGYGWIFIDICEIEIKRKEIKFDIY